MWGGKKYWLILKKKFQDLKLVSWSKTTRGHWVRVAGAWYWRNNQELLPVTINHHHCTLHAQFDPLFGAAFFAANKCIAMGLFLSLFFGVDFFASSREMIDCRVCDKIFLNLKN